ncbi:MAG TPA: AMP-binding protein [Pseudonocardiaceae bacterium]|nr:AMP-binding protein [Pseudonocardiaceae bacterium]
MDVELSDLPVTSYVFEYAQRWPDQPALIDGLTGVAISYQELIGAVRRAAAGFVAHGMAKGDVMALCSPNRPEFVITYYAALAAGGVVTTVNPMATAAELAGQLRSSGARWMVTTPELFERKVSAAAAAADTAAAQLREVFVFGACTGAAPFAALLNDAPPAPTTEIGADHLAVLLYSSGTTGLPKAVMLSHRNLVASLCQTRLVQLVRPGDVVIAALPLFHIYGMQVTLNLALHEGATIVTMPRFELETFLRLVQQYRATRIDVVPPIVLALAKQSVVDDYDLSSLRVITSSAAPLGGELARSCAARLGCRVKQGYGMTELGGATHCAPDTGRDDPESIGPALPGVQCRVVESVTGADVGPGEHGELLIRTPAAMRGYLNNPAATADTVEPDGWVHTGDIVVQDADGWFRVVDRRKELIKYNAYQVAPAELEAVLLSHPAVADAAVIASPDERSGEVPKAFVVLSSPASAEELLDFVAQRVSPYKRIRIVEFIDEIPKSASGKILRRLLVERDRALIASGR